MNRRLRLGARRIFRGALYLKTPRSRGLAPGGSGQSPAFSLKLHQAPKAPPRSFDAIRHLPAAPEFTKIPVMASKAPKKYKGRTHTNRPSF